MELEQATIRVQRVTTLIPYEISWDEQRYHIHLEAALLVQSTAMQQEAKLPHTEATKGLRESLQNCVLNDAVAHSRVLKFPAENVSPISIEGGWFFISQNPAPESIRYPLPIEVFFYGACPIFTYTPRLGSINPHLSAA